MKKILSIILAALMIAALVSGCGAKEPENDVPPSEDNTDAAVPDDANPDNGTEDNAATPDETPDKEELTIRIGGLKGPTSIGLVKLMEDNENDVSANNYEFTVAGAADELTPKLVQGELDIAAVPANLASVLYNNTEGAINILAINTLGVVYITAKGEEITSVSDLAGKTIYATGKGSTPEYALRFILSKNGIDPDKDVTIEWKSEPTEIVALLQGAENGIAMLPQPFATAAQAQVEGLTVALNLTEEWNKIESESMLITGTLVVNKAFAQEHPEELAAFMAEYEASTAYANENVSEAAQLVEKFGLFKAAIAEKAIPLCNITFISGKDMIEPLEGYLGVLFEQNPKAIGGAIPGADFYYEVQQ